MIENDEIIIDETNIDNQPIKRPEDENIDSKNNEIIGEINNIEEKSESQKNIMEKEDISNLKDENYININNYSPSKSSISGQKEKESESSSKKNLIFQRGNQYKINFTSFIDNISTNPTKEESLPLSLDLNKKLNEEKYSTKTLENEEKIDGKDENKALEKILHPIKNDFKSPRNNSTTVLNGNQLYFTETKIPKVKFSNNIKKSNSNKQFKIPILPKYPGTNKNNMKSGTTGKLNIIPERKSNLKISKSINAIVNNLSPEKYMRKRIVNNFNFNPLEFRIKQMEEEIQKQNNYDYKKAMKELQFQYDKKIKNKQKEKQIFQQSKKMKEKLKSMEEYRNHIINQKIEKFNQKQDKMKNSKSLNRSHESISMLNINNNISRNNQNTNTMVSYEYNSFDNQRKKLPSISSLPKYEMIRLIKNKKEEEFCYITEKRIKENELHHRKNYLKQLRLMNKKFLKQNKIYNERNLKCLNAIKVNVDQLEEDYMEKDMIKRYNINRNLLRERSAQKEKVRENLRKNLDGVREKKELIKQEEEQKIKDYIKRLNREVKKEDIYEYLFAQRSHFLDLQKKNLIKTNKESRDFYHELILRQEDRYLILDEIEKEEPMIKQAILRRTIKEQNKKKNKLKSLGKFMGKMDKTNINNQSDEAKNKLFQEKRKIDIEKKKKQKEEEEELNKK